jgi:cobalt-precorrin 5A hydrolase
VAFDLPVRPLIKRLFGEQQGLVLFMPVGAAVRLLAPSILDKHSDPPVVCVDEAGRFVVSLLSGHLGGADQLAQEVADALGATPVVTSAAHVIGTLAVDLLGREWGWQIEAEPGAVTRASAAVVNGEPVGIFHQVGETEWWPTDQPMPPNVTTYASLEAPTEASCAAALIISDQRSPWAGHDSQPEAPVVMYRPRTLVAGMGCRRGVPMAELEEILVDTFESHNLALGSLRCIATAELKQEELGLIQLANKFEVPMLCYSAGQLNSVFTPQPLPESQTGGANPSNPAVVNCDDGEPWGKQSGATAQTSAEGNVGPTRHPRVRELLGMWGVSEPAALLAAGTELLLMPRIKTQRVTIAVARMEFGASTAPVAPQSPSTRYAEA